MALSTNTKKSRIHEERLLGQSPSLYNFFLNILYVMHL